MINRCIDCTERRVGCHSNCEDYKEYIERSKTIKMARYEEAKKNRGTISHDRYALRKLRGKK